MSYFTSAEQIYTVMKSLFQNLNRMEPNPVNALRSINMVICITLTDPDANITFNGRNRPVTIDYGSPNGRADMVIGMSADTLHLILLDEYSIRRGFSNGELKLRGPIWKALSFADIFQKVKAYYPKVLKEQGLI